jgi:general secretion pathway protein D
MPAIFFGTNRVCCVVMSLLLLSGCGAQQHHRKGMAALERQDYPYAVGELERAAELDPKNIEYRRDWLRTREVATDRLLSAANGALGGGDAPAAAHAFREVLRFDRDNARAQDGLERLGNLARADAHAVEARAALKSGDTDKAMELSARALKLSPGHSTASDIRREIDALLAQEMLLTPTFGALYKKPINLEFRDASVKLVFDALSRTTGINFIFDRDIRGDQRTTVFLKQTSLEDAIDVILSTSQLEKRILNESSVLIYPNTPAKMREYQDLIVRAFYMANVEAKQAANMLKTVLKLKDVYVDDKANMLILRENPETIALAEKLIKLQDLEEPEVMLEVEVLEINRSRLLNAGIQWSSQLVFSPLGGSTSIPGSGATTATMKLSDLKNITSNNIGITVPSATVNLQKTDGDANLLANPRIRVRDREKAKILIGDKVPVVTTTSSGTFVTENIQYLDVGLKLEVEPDIHLRDEVGLKLSLEVSSLVSSIKTNNGSQAYQIGTRNFSSALRLRDGETQILAGLISDEDRSSANKIPLIGDLPLLGRLFGSQNDTRQKTEIVLSITPHLIRNRQRKDPTAESFWSGTEATLRNRPLQLRSAPAGGKPDSTPAAAKPGTPSAAAPAQKPPAGDPGAPALAWEGAAEAKVGEDFTLRLNIDSLDALRAASLQLAYNPAEFELKLIDDGGYFGNGDQVAVSKSTDAAGGRASISMNGTADGGVRGGGRLLSVTLRPLAPSANAKISVIAMTPIGAVKAIGRPGMPLPYKVAIAP